MERSTESRRRKESAGFGREDPGRSTCQTISKSLSSYHKYWCFDSWSLDVSTFLHIHFLGCCLADLNLFLFLEVEQQLQDAVWNLKISFCSKLQHENLWKCQDTMAQLDEMRKAYNLLQEQDRRGCQYWSQRDSEGKIGKSAFDAFTNIITSVSMV